MVFLKVVELLSASIIIDFDSCNCRKAALNSVEWTMRQVTLDIKPGKDNFLPPQRLEPKYINPKKRASLAKKASITKYAHCETGGS